MKITFDKRVYYIEDGEDKYEVTHIVKHPNKEYDTDSYFFNKYETFDDPEMNGYWVFGPSAELKNKIKEYIVGYEQS